MKRVAHGEPKNECNSIRTGWLRRTDEPPLVASCVFHYEVLHQAIADSRETPNHGYLFAILEAANGQMAKLEAGLAESRKFVPIIASWRPISGSPNEVIDVWKSPEPQQKYEPAGEWRKKFLRSVRLLAPKERAMRLVALPFSPLR